MSWQVNIDKTSQEDGKLVLYTTFFDPTRKLGETFRFDGGSDLDTRWKRTLQDRINKLNESDLTFVKIPTGIPDLTIPPPTPEQQAQTAYLNALSNNRQMQKAVQLNIKKADDADVTAAAQKVITDFQDIYLPLL